MRKLKISIGDKIGSLTVLQELPSPSHRKLRLQCTCGNVVDMYLNNIRGRHIKSCRKCRSNSYTIKKGVVYGKDSKQREFSLDEKDFPLISGKVVYVHTTNYGEVIVWDSGKRVVLHDLLCIGYDKNKLVVNHIDFDLTNNRRSNLRLVDKGSDVIASNKSAYYCYKLLGIDATINKDSKEWVVNIVKNGITLYAGLYESLTSATYAYKLWLYFNYSINDASLFLGIPRVAKIDFVKRTGSKKRDDMPILVM